MSETIGGYLIRRLGEEGIGHVFGVPGDYVLTFFKQMEESPLKVINTCDEQGAGFAADAYARVRGFGAACITCCVGGLKIANPVAQAFAEKSPVVLISGAPGTKERRRNTLLHHKIREFDTQLRIFTEITVGAAVLDDPATAAAEIIPAARRELPPETSEPEALAQARGRKDWSLIQVMLPRDDHSPALQRLTASLRERVARSKG